MRLTLNLASKPFIELRPLFQRIRIAMISLAVIAIALLFVLHSARKNAADAQAQMGQIRNRTAALHQERSANETRMRETQNASVLNRALFLNDLFKRKSFSWTAVMMDLETVLPAGVQVTNIQPQMGSDGELQIRLRVMGDREQAVDLVRNLEKSKRFVAPRLAAENSQTQESGNAQRASFQAGGSSGVEFEILSGYNPLPVTVRVKDLKQQRDKESEQEKRDATSGKYGVVLPPAPKPQASAVKTQPAKKGGAQ